MEEFIDMKKIRQTVYRESHQDGINEIFMGMFFFYYTFILDDLCKGVRMEGPIAIFFILMCAYPILYYNVIRNSFTYPRMGYVHLKEKITVSFALTVITPLILIPIIMYFIVWFLNDFFDIALIVKWLSVAFGLIFASLYFSFAKKFGKKFYYFLTGFSVIAGIVLSQVSLALSGAAIVILVNGLILLIYGVYMLIRFMKKYPKPKMIQTELKKDTEE